MSLLFQFINQKTHYLKYKKEINYKEDFYCNKIKRLLRSVGGKTTINLKN